MSMIWAAFLAASPSDWSALPPGVKPAIEDTYIDESVADANFGRSEVLISGPGKLVLIRPTDLSLLVPKGHKIVDASVTLTTREPNSPQVTEAVLLTAPWFEGPGRAGGLVPAEGVARWAATWNHARAGDGGSRWNKAGASGPNDREPIPGLTTAFDLGSFSIRGLGPALQKMLENPGRYTGIAFTTKDRAQFLSAEFGGFGPMFRIETDPIPSGGPDIEVVELSASGPSDDGQNVNWEARLKNVGDKASAPGTAVWSHRYASGSTTEVPAIQPGAEAVVSLPLASRTQPDKRFNPLSVRVDVAGDIDPSNNFKQVDLGAIAVAVVVDGKAASDEAQQGFRRFVDSMNLRVFPLSRFGFAAEGVTERVRYVSDPARAAVKVEAASLDSGAVKAMVASILNMPAAFFNPPAPGPIPEAPFVGLTPDSRDEWGYLAGVPYPERLWPPRTLGQPLLPDSLLLGRSESALLQILAGKKGEDRNPAKLPTSNILILRAYDGGGRPLNKIKVTVYQPQGGATGAPIFTGETSDAGTVLLSARSFTDKRNSLFGTLNPDGSNAWLQVEFEAQGEKTTRWIPYLQMVEEALRGGLGATTLEYRMMLSDKAIDRSQNLVAGKSVTDSNQRFPAELNEAIDGNLKTAIDLPGEPAWIEIDLGRDRGVGEVQLVFQGEEPWSSFVIQAYNTSQRPEQARGWINEEYPAMRARVQGQPKDGMVTLTYLGGSTSVRYLRILKRSGSAKLAEVIVHPIAGG